MRIFLRHILGVRISAVFFIENQQEFLNRQRYELLGEEAFLLAFSDHVQKSGRQFFVLNQGRGNEKIVGNTQRLKNGRGGLEAMKLPILTLKGVNFVAVDRNDVPWLCEVELASDVNLNRA